MDSRINLGWYFSDSGQANAQAALSNAKADILQKVEQNKAIQNLEQLETNLNNIFKDQRDAGGNLVNQEARRFEEAMIQECSQTIEEAFKNFQFPTTDAQIDAVKISQSKTSADYTLQNIIATTEASLRDLEGSLKNGGSLQSYTAKIQGIKSVLNSAKRFCETIAADYSLFGKTDFYDPNDGTGAMAVRFIKQMTAFNRAINGGRNISPKRLGDLFEEALRNAGGQYMKNVKAQVLKESIIAIKTGSKTVSRGVYQGKGMDNISYSVNIQDLGQDEISQLKNQGFKYSEDSLQLTYTYSPGEAKMGKMDVVVKYQTGTFQDPIERLRISAKNWLHDTREVGETSIDAGLSRAVGHKIAEYYRMALLDSTKDERRKEGDSVVQWICCNEAHTLARLALASDIVMGLNQGKVGMANVLVINTPAKIYVKDISTLVREIESNENRLYGYNKDSLTSSALNTYQSMKNVDKGRSSLYMGKMTSTLNKMKVSYNLMQNLE